MTTRILIERRCDFVHSWYVINLHNPTIVYSSLSEALCALSNSPDVEIVLAYYTGWEQDYNEAWSVWGSTIPRVFEKLELPPTDQPLLSHLKSGRPFPDLLDLASQVCGGPRDS